ncbi:MAG: conserved membrane protein of unknown function [Promethearchaeota archaeon]|nr:MAG: conserved membrane protein of unknown function [Candidatus Lokiarchaeota archaeon]
MNIRQFLYELRSKFTFQALKQAWLDLKRDKAKLIFAISGLAISIFLLVAIGSINDSLSYNYIQLATENSSEADIIVSRIPSGGMNYDPYFEESVINEKLTGVPGIKQFFPRITMVVDASSEAINRNASVQMYGIDFMRELMSGDMGDLKLASKFISTDFIYAGKPDKGECVVLKSVAEYLNLSRGDTIRLSYQQYEQEFVVDQVCTQDKKFMTFETALIILNLEDAQEFLNKENKINFIYASILDPESIYDASNIDTTIQKARDIGISIQLRLDINQYLVSMPKLEELSQGEYFLMTATVIFWFIIMLTMMITAILINSILSTSAEERMREFGIFRVVGGKKKFPIKIVLIEGLILGILGSIIGVLMGYFLTEPISNLFLSTLDFGFSNITFITQPVTLILGAIVGILVSLCVSFIPAIKAARKDLIKSITPFRAEEEGFEVKKETSVKVKLMLIGFAISIVGLIMFILMPRVLVTGDVMLVNGLFIGLLVVILIGLVFASIGIIPLLQRLLLGMISPIIKKYYHIIRISLKRYRRRNISTILMFALSFSFIFFITGLTEMEEQNSTLSLNFQYGSDVIITNEGGINSEDSLTMQMINEIRAMPRVEQVAIVLHNSLDLQSALSSLFSGSLEGGEESMEEIFQEIFEFYFGEERTKYEVRVSDIAQYSEVEAGFIGVNPDFVNLIDKELIIWSSPNSGEDSFLNLFLYNNTCIISKAIADRLNINEIGSPIRLTFTDPQIEDDPGNTTIFQVVGISGGMPGFWNFRSSFMAASGGGVMVSLNTYMDYMDIENAGSSNMIVDKAYINLRVNTEIIVEDFKEDLETQYSNIDFTIDDSVSKINDAIETNESRSALMELILVFTVLISIFGLVSNMFAVIKERKFEIGILRSMGLKTSNIRQMFLTESIIVMISSALMGFLIGLLSAYLLETTMALITEMPTVFSIPWDTVLRVFSITIIVGIIGMYIILWNTSKKSVVEIFRQTF